MARTTARVDGATLVLPERDATPITLDTPAWFAWLENATTFAFRSPSGHFTARKERQARGGGYWKAYRTSHGSLHRVYLGKAQDLTLDRLNQAAATLAAAAPLPAVRTAARPAPATVLSANLLATKLFIPPARTNLVVRPRLFERLPAGLQTKLTLVAAPAGFGKTTLLSAWRATPEGSALLFGWVSLDRADNDPLRFWSYVITALDTLVLGVGTTALALLQAPQPPPMEHILTSVVNAFSATAAVPPVRDVALILDDYHEITAPAIHDALALLLEYLPPQLHLVILTRADPALPMARLRARGAVTELHASDLRFTPDEGAAFLNQVMGLSLTATDLAALEARIQNAERGIQPDTPADQVQLIQGRAAAIRANIARYTGDLAGCVAFAQQVLRLLPETETIARTIGMLHVARAFRVSGDVRDEAERRVIAVIAPFQAANNLLGTLAAITNLARLQVLQGRLHAAAATYREMTQIASRPDEPLLLEGPAYYAGMGAVLYEWNDLDAAEWHLAQAMEQLEGRLVVDAEDVALGYLALARLQQGRGNYADAQRTLETYTDLARQRGFVAHLIARGRGAGAARIGARQPCCRRRLGKREQHPEGTRCYG